MKRYAITILVSSFVTVIFLNISQTIAAPKEIFKAISFLTKIQPDCIMANEWVNRINKEFKKQGHIPFFDLA